MTDDKEIELRKKHLRDFEASLGARAASNSLARDAITEKYWRESQTLHDIAKKIEPPAIRKGQVFTLDRTVPPEPKRRTLKPPPKSSEFSRN